MGVVQTYRSGVRRALKWIVAPLVVSAGPALACPPPLPGQTESERLKPAFDSATDIVYGVVLKGARDGEIARFKVIHVYKGRLLAGQVIDAVPTYGFDPVPCVEFPYPPSAGKGTYGVVAFRLSPALNFIDERTLRLAFQEGWIRSAQR